MANSILRCVISKDRNLSGLYMTNSGRNTVQLCDHHAQKDDRIEKVQCQFTKILLLLLLVWHAPLGVRSAKRRHQSPEWTILSHSYRLMQGEIVRPQVLLDSLHPCSSRTSWWSPTVLRRGSSYDTPGICLVWHSRNVAVTKILPVLQSMSYTNRLECLGLTLLEFCQVRLDLIYCYKVVFGSL